MRLIGAGNSPLSSLFLPAKDPAKEIAEMEEQQRKMAPVINDLARQLSEGGITRGDTRRGWREWYEEPDR